MSGTITGLFSGRLFTFYMPVTKEHFLELRNKLAREGVLLVAVSKMQSTEAIQLLYEYGHRDFGENYVQELLQKQEVLPPDIRWHFIGHLQSNKVKYIAPFVYLIHGVDRLKLLIEINKAGNKLDRRIEVLLQVHIAQEETKFGLNEKELAEILSPELLSRFTGVRIRGLMGMASLTDDSNQIRKEFGMLKNLFDHYRKTSAGKGFDTLSMGMSGDYTLAVEEGSSMVRIGSLLFGQRSIV